MDVHHVPRALPWADISLPLWGSLIQIVIILPKLELMSVKMYSLAGFVACLSALPWLRTDVPVRDVFRFQPIFFEGQRWSFSKFSITFAGSNRQHSLIR